MTFTLGSTVVTKPGMWGFGRIDGYPVSADVSSPFGPRTPIQTPVGWTSDFHGGIDLPCAGGTPIYCPVEELHITAEGPALNGYGNVVFGVTPEGFTLVFAHMRDGAHAGVGAVLRRGDLIGLVGTTGASTGDHLHFGLAQLPGGMSVTDINAWIASDFWLNPMDYFGIIEAVPPSSPPMDAFDFAAFIQNSLRALATNPPVDMNAALLELARRVEYLRTILS